MSWNWRVVRRYINDRSTWLDVCAVVYANGTPAHIINPPRPSGRSESDTLQEMRATIRMQELAFRRPVLDERADFGVAAVAAPAGNVVPMQPRKRKGA